MGKESHNTLFNLIAPVYGLFYNKQKNRYREVIGRFVPDWQQSGYTSILDVGCGGGLADCHGAVCLSEDIRRYPFWLVFDGAVPITMIVLFVFNSI